MSVKNRMGGKKILFFLDRLSLGGAEAQSVLFADYLQQKQYTIQYVGFSKSDDTLTDILDRKNIPWKILPRPVFRFSLSFFFGTALFLRAFIRLKPDVIMSYLIVPNCICGIFWKITRAKACIWNQRDEGLHKVPAFIERRAIKNMSAFITNSIGGRKYLLTKKIESNKINLIYNGVRPAFSTPKNRLKVRDFYNIPTDAILICMVANISKYKDHETLIEAWHIVTGELPNIFLILVGKKEEEYRRIQMLVRERQMNKSIIFTDYLDNPYLILCASDIYVHSSKSEGMPNAVLEAMVHGLPVAGTKIPGIEEILSPKNRCLLSEAGNANALAHHLKDLIKSEELRKKLGEANKQKALRKYSIEAMCTKTYNVMREWL